MGLFDFGKKKKQIAEEIPGRTDAEEPVKEEAEEKEDAGSGGGAEADASRQFDSVYMFIPVFEKPVDMPPGEEIQRALSDVLGHMTPTMDPLPEFPEESGLMVWDLWQHIANSRKDQSRHPAKLVMTGNGAFNRNQWNEFIVGQFWCCGEKRREFADKCNYSFVCSIMLEGHIERKHHYRMVTDYADAILELFPECIGIYWPASQNLVPREYFRTDHWGQPELHFLDGGLNIRMFRFTGREEVLYDTLGLDIIGLSDLQIYCKGLEPETAVPFLKNIASYLFLNGNVLQDGSALLGLHKEGWVCQRGDSLAAPGREVINLYPMPQGALTQEGAEARAGENPADVAEEKDQRG